MKEWIAPFLIFSILGTTPVNASVSPIICRSNLPAGTVCVKKIITLRPTQPEIGKYEIHLKRKKYAKKLKGADHYQQKLEAMKVESTAPVIIGPDGNYYLLDHHHTALTLHEMGEKEMYVKVESNWTSLGKGQSMEKRMVLFWKQLEERNLCYLKSAEGVMMDPLSAAFPKNLLECGDNKLRSLVYLLIKDGTIVKTGIKYDEFYKAEVLQNLGITVTDDDYEKEVAIAKERLSSPTGIEAMEAATKRQCRMNVLRKAFDH